MSEPIEIGSLGRIIEDVPANEGERSLRKDQLFIIEDYVSSEEAEDRTPFYWGSTLGTGNFNDVCVDASKVRLAKTVEQMAARRIPTTQQICDFLGSQLLGDGEGFSINETDRDGESGIEIAGQTDDGLHFAANIRVTSIYETDF